MFANLLVDNMEQEKKTIQLTKREMEAVKWVLDKYLKVHEIFDIPEGHHEVVMSRIREILKKEKDMN